MRFPAGLVRVVFLAAVVLMSGAAADAGADSFPVRPVKIIVPSTPGDGSDLVARSIGQKLGEAWGQPVVIENRPGAGGRIGTEAAARSRPDGYTWIMGNAGSHGINAALYSNLPYDVERDFAPITQVMRAPNVLVVSPQLGVSSFGELLKLFKASPGKYSYASGGNGSSAHLSAELFKLMAGVDLVHVPYKGAGPAMTDLMAGEVAMFLGNLPPAAAHIKSGRLRALGVTTLKRSPLLPDVPTLDEAGLAGFETVAWFGLFAPAGTPADVIGKTRSEVARIAALPEIQEQIRTLGGEVVAGTPQDLKALVQDDIAKWRRVVDAAGIKAE